MASMILWMLSLTISVCALILSTAAGTSSIHMAVTAIISLGFALLAVSEHTKRVNAGFSKSSVASSTARYMALVWIWGALGLFVTYTLRITDVWQEWWQFFLGFAAVGLICLGIAIMNRNNSRSGKEDDTMHMLSRYLTIAQLIGMVATMVGLVIDGKFPVDSARPDWPANNIFFFGAAALAAISLHALLNERKA
jgi:hypothetical protein